MNIQAIQKRLGVDLQPFDPWPIDEPILAQQIRYDRRNTYTLNEAGEVIGLNLRDNQLMDEQLAFLWELETLQALNLSENKLQLVHIPPTVRHLQYLQLSKNEHLNRLTLDTGFPNLVRLDVSSCALSELSFKRGFDSLHSLYLQKNKLQRCQFEAAPPKLASCDLSDNELVELIMPEGFVSLRQLYLMNNKLQDLTFLPVLPMLNTLHLRGNVLKDLLEDAKHPETNFLDKVPALESLYLYANPLPSVYAGFIENDEYKSCLEDVQRVFRDMIKGTKIDNECKVLLIGNGKAGKTTFVTKLVTGEFAENYISTHAIEIARFPHRNYVFFIWDFAGQDIYHATHRLFMQRDSIYLLFWDKELEDGYVEIKEGGKMRQYENYSRRYWLAYAQNQGGSSPVLLVQTKVGEKGENKEADFKDLIAQFGEQFDLLEFLPVESSIDDWDDNGYEALFSSLRKSIKKIKGGQAIPASYAAIRKELRKMMADKKKTLSLQNYMALVAKLPDAFEKPMKVLKDWLVKTGVVYYSEGLFNNEIILNQDWAIDAIYCIFDRKKGHLREIEKEEGCVNGEYLNEVWKGNTPDERALFLSFMESCKLCIETFQDEENRYRSFAERTFIIPQLLPEKEPRHLDQDIPAADSLFYKFNYSFLHKGVIPELIYEASRLAKYNEMWRSGILLRLKGQAVIVKATKAFELLIQIKRNSQELLAAVLNTLKEIQPNAEGEKWVSLNGEDYFLFEELESSIGKEISICSAEGKEEKVENLLVFLDEKKREGHNIRNILRGSKFEKEVLPYREVIPDPEKPVFLFAFANDEKRSLDLGEEIDACYDALADSSTSDVIRYVALANASYDKVIREFNRYHNQICIFHYGGHSNKEVLKFLGTDGSAKNFGTIVGQEGYLKLVFLNGCENYGQVDLLFDRGVKAVIATTAAVGDVKAIALASSFYKALASGKNIREAFDHAKSEIFDRYPALEATYRGTGFREEEAPDGSFLWTLDARDSSVLDWKIPNI